MIDRQNRDGVTVLRMSREPANVLDREFGDAIVEALNDAIDGPATAIVLTGTGGIFSAGVDLFRILEEGDAYLADFLECLDRLFETAVTSPKPLVAAINGHAIAGGAVLAFACDFRVMAEGSAKIGLPELEVGVPFPGTALRIIRSAVPEHALREVVLRGRNFGPEAALARGIIDELAAPEDVLDRAVTLAADLGSIPARAFAVTKALLGTDVADDREAAARETEVHEIWRAAETHDHIRQYLQRTLGKRGR